MATEFFDVTSPIKRNSSRVKLPSRGFPYPGIGLSSGEVEVAAMRLSDEAKFRAALSSVGGRQAIIQLLQDCVVAPNDFHPSVLLPVDERFILYMIRITSFGPEYTFQWTCPNCAHNNDVSISLSEVMMVDAMEKAEPFSVKLPDSGVTVGFRLLRNKDFDKMESKFPGSSPSDEAKREILSYVYQTVSLNSTKVENLEQKDVYAFWSNIGCNDALKFDQAVIDVAPRIKTTFKSACSSKSCGYVYEGDIPMTPEFFRPRVSSD